MYQKLILKNIKFLNCNILKGVLENMDINLSDDEAIVVTNIIKENAYDLLDGKYEESFRILKANTSSLNYRLLTNLYFEKIRPR